VFHVSIWGAWSFAWGLSPPWWRDCCVLSPWREILQNSSACVWQCKSCWQLCLHWSWHYQRRKFQNMCVWRNTNLKCWKTWIVSCHCADAI